MQIINSGEAYANSRPPPDSVKSWQDAFLYRHHLEAWGFPVAVAFRARDLPLFEFSALCSVAMATTHFPSGLAAWEKGILYYNGINRKGLLFFFKLTRLISNTL